MDRRVGGRCSTVLVIVLVLCELGLPRSRIVVDAKSPVDSALTALAALPAAIVISPMLLLRVKAIKAAVLSRSRSKVARYYVVVSFIRFATTLLRIHRHRRG